MYRRLFPSLRWSSSLASTLALGALLAACDRPSGEVREWAVGDHDQPASAPNPPPARPASSARPAAPPDDASLVELSWDRSCTPCHGRGGKGDGPQGAMLRAPDLTLAEWQGKVSDQDIAAVIRSGRNKMPSFDKLPPQVIDGLVKRIRANKSR